MPLKKGRGPITVSSAVADKGGEKCFVSGSLLRGKRRLMRPETVVTLIMISLRNLHTRKTSRSPLSPSIGPSTIKQFFPDFKTGTRVMAGAGVMTEIFSLFLHCTFREEGKSFTHESASSSPLSLISLTFLLLW